MHIQGSAEFFQVSDHHFRHRLDRWHADGPRALVVMANPSFAGADNNDQTIHRLNVLLLPRYAGYSVVNFCPFIATNPADLYRWRDQFSRSNPVSYKQIHETNIALIREISAGAPIRIIAWGALVPQVPHATHVLLAASLNRAHPLYCFGTTKDGSPKHPMARGRHRIPDGTLPSVWRAAAA